MTSMNGHSTPVAVARAFTEAWTSGDLETTARYVAEDVVFDGPLGHVEGKQAYLDGLKGLTQAVDLTGARVLAAFGDEAQALIMYDLITNRFGTLRCAKLLAFSDGKIQTDTLTFDSYEIKKARG